MIVQFRTSYAAYRWARVATRAGLGIAGIVLLATGGGFPPWAWRFLSQVMSQLPRLWSLRGPGMLFPFVGLLLLALTLFLLWGCFALAAVLIVRDWLQRRRDLREFKHELTEARGVARRATARVAPTLNESGVADGPRQGRGDPRGRPSGYTPVAEAGRTAGTAYAASAPVAPSFAAQAPSAAAPRQNGYHEMRPYGHGSMVPTMPIAVAEVVDDLPESAITLDVGTAHDVGIKRKEQPNEDSLLALPNLLASRKGKEGRQPLALFVVADGMGGHGNGQEASRLAISALHDAMQLALLDGLADDVYEELLAEGAHNANLAIHQRNRQKQADMGTTLTAALIAGNTAYLANVGDSRTYLYREDEGLSQITRDHSAVARLVEVGAITPREVYTHPKRNEIYRSLGNSSSVKVDTYSVPLKIGDLLLLCSDGLWEMVYDDEIERIIASWLPSPAQVCEALLQAALRGGGKDNISIIAVRVKNR